MRCVLWFMILSVSLSAGLVRAEDPPRRTTRVASAPGRSTPMKEPSSPRLAPRPAVPTAVHRPAAPPSALLEPSFQLEGVGRGMVVCFQVQAPQAAEWQLVVREIDGPVAQIFEGEGSPPSSIPWDGRLIDGGLAWSGMPYSYHLAYVDSSGAVGEVAGRKFSLPAYSREDRQGISFLVPGSRLTPGRRGDAVASAAAGLESVAERLNAEGGLATVRVEVLARDETSALNLGGTIRTALADMLDLDGRTVELYVGPAAAAPPDGTVLITTVSLPNPNR